MPIYGAYSGTLFEYSGILQYSGTRIYITLVLKKFSPNKPL